MTLEAIELINSFWVSMMLFIFGIAAIQGVGALIFLLIDWAITKRNPWE